MIIKNNDHNVHQPASNQNHYQFTNHHQQGELFSPDREDAEETAEPSEAKLSRLSWNMLRKIIIKNNNNNTKNMQILECKNKVVKRSTEAIALFTT